MARAPRLSTPRLGVVLVAARLLTGCDEAPASPEQGLCQRAAGCQAMEMLVSTEACTQQVRRRLTDAHASVECRQCALSLPCSGMARVASGRISLAQLCPACSTAVTSPDKCTSGHVLICGIAMRPPAAPSGSASGPPPSASSSVPVALSPSASALPAGLPRLPAVPKLPTAPLPAAR